MSAPAHARLGPSGAHRWMRCAGSALAEAEYPDRRTTTADEGSAAHALAEWALTTGGDLGKRVGELVSPEWPVEITPEMSRAVGDYVDYVIGLGGAQFYEDRFDLGHVVPGSFGTSDAIALVGDVIYVVDLKYGKGVKVYAEQNEQAMLYALGALELHNYREFSRVICVIVQPRLDHIDEWETTPAELAEFAERARLAAVAANDPTSPRTPGTKQCQFCRAKAACPALRSYTEAAICAQFDALPDAPPAPERLTDAQLRQALEAKSLITAWLGAVEDLVKQRLESGEGFPGFKLVSGRALRRWADTDKAADALESLIGHAAWSRELISVSQAEKVMGKKKAAELLGPLITKPDGKPTLVPESDPREPITITTADCFDAFTNDQR